MENNHSEVLLVNVNGHMLPFARRSGADDAKEDDICEHPVAEIIHHRFSKDPIGQIDGVLGVLPRRRPDSEHRCAA